MTHLIEIITASDPSVRNRSLDAFARQASLSELIEECAALDAFRKRSDNLYERVRALFFLYAIHRFHLPARPDMQDRGLIPFVGYEHLLNRRFEEAIAVFQRAWQENGPNNALSSALAETYHRLAFQTLADQVRRSVRTVRGNQWMFRIGHPADQPLRIRRELFDRGDAKEAANGLNVSSCASSSVILRERTPVRMDLSHSAWSDIFFLGMDFPEGARVLNVSIDLAVRGRDAAPRPPVEAYLRVIDEPVLRLTSVDLGATADLTHLRDVFDFARDYLGLLKAAIIASGIVPPGMEGADQPLSELLARLVGPGYGLELVSNVNDIPKGSRLAVSTSLLACLIACCMRATGQAKSLTGPLAEHERRLVAARAILGEWLAGSGGGWQDSGGVWPGMKLIYGVLAEAGDPEYGISRGRLLPNHKILDQNDASDAVRQMLQDSLILVHGGMAQNVGPILEMVTEKYLLRSEAEWIGRRDAMQVLDDILIALRGADPRQAVKEIGRLTTHNFFGPLQTIIPWASNLYTETLIERAKRAFGEAFWGFWMLGGMSGGGMGFIVAPEIAPQAKAQLHDIMLSTKRELQYALPFAMDPVVYDFAINPIGTRADLLCGEDALMPTGYYALHAPRLVKLDQRMLTPARRADLDRFANATRSRPEFAGMTKALFDRLLPQLDRTAEASGATRSLEELLSAFGFDRALHEQIRADLRSGRIGLAQNRLPANVQIEDVPARALTSDAGHPVVDATDRAELGEFERIGIEALRDGRAAVMTLAAGAGSRWTQGAGVVKALHPFAKLGGTHRSFIEVHLAKSRRVARQYDARLPHIITTSYLTHGPIESFIINHPSSPDVPIYLSEGRSVGLRMVPMARDLRFQWEEMPQQLLDEQAQKVRESLHAALISWAQHAGEGSDYTDNTPMQCLHPVGHWFEVPNLLRNGTLCTMLDAYPNLRYLMLHNIDTLGADVDPALLGLHIARGACLTFEVITRRVEDRGGGLARVDGQIRLVEGLAMPREEAEFVLSYYNSATCWIDIYQLLDVFGLTPADLNDERKVSAAIRAVGARMPTYITLKDVKKRWGHGQEDIFPVTQWEKLWGDMTALPNVKAGFAVVPRLRGQQLKDQAQLDGWLRDGSAAYVERLCMWS
ncbi:MAG: UTP--glucose-1-phosphate uridylyltransferase [Candidatus Roseilinea sp.]|nr:MAG: UTP--glucose-1-phosphate uridylyltransferase [Candidatus Roseilinea sp.]